MEPRGIQRAINNAIAAPNYNPPLPALDDVAWKKVFDWQKHYFSNNCLEWLGDGLMYAAISVELYRQVPRGNPHMYTMIRRPIVTNQTFALLTNKMNLSGALIRASGSKDPSPTAKCFADMFEVIPAEVYLRGGFDVLRQWVAEVFGPLIKAAVLEYEAHPPTMKRKWLEDQDRLTGKASFEPDKRQKTVHIYNTNSKVADPHTSLLSSAFNAALDASFPRLVGNAGPGPHSYQDRPSGFHLFQAQAPNAALTNLSHGTPLASSSAPSKSLPSGNMAALSVNLGAEKLPMKPVALSECSRNTPSSSQGPTQRPAPGPSRPSRGQGSLTATHSAVWERALGQASDPGNSGLHAVMLSPSRYIAAPPSAPACGPGSSRSDPIIIDDDDEHDEDDDDDDDNGDPGLGAHGMAHQIIELSDDDDTAETAGSAEEEVENLLGHMDSTKISGRKH